MDGWLTRRLEYELEDERGRTHRSVGTPTAITLLPTWPNQYNNAGVVRWSSEGRLGWASSSGIGDVGHARRPARAPGQVSNTEQQLRQEGTGVSTNRIFTDEELDHLATPLSIHVERRRQGTSTASGWVSSR